jgi:glycosyltransferase involved in cell wall biosynthesis
MKTIEKKKTILMIYVSLSSFVKRDIYLLKDSFHIIEFQFDVSKKWKLPFAFINQLFFLLKNRNIDVIITQSSGYLSFLPAIWKKFSRLPLIIIAIGTDSISIPEIKYGAFNKVILSWFTRYSYKNASLILPVHKSLIFNIYTYTNIKFKEQGIKSFIKNLKTPIFEVVNGFDENKWKITNYERKSNTFLTITTSLSKTGYFLKGIDMIDQIARKYPNFKFTVIGDVFFPNDIPYNINVVKNVSSEELLEYYNSHKYYLQLSISEGFPNTLCEAMLCGCIPIGSNVAAIPDIIGDKGYVLKEKKITDLEGIFKNLTATFPMQDIRERVIHNFKLAKRKNLLIKHIEDLINGKDKKHK